MWKKVAIYLVGVFVLGLLHWPVKNYLENDVLFVLVAISYLIVLKFVADRFN